MRTELNGLIPFHPSATAATHCDSMPICLSYIAVWGNYQPIWWDSCSYILRSYLFELGRVALCLSHRWNAMITQKEIAVDKSMCLNDLIGT